MNRLFLLLSLYFFMAFAPLWGAACCNSAQLSGDVAETLGRVQMIQDKVNLIQKEVGPLGPQLATLQAILCSKIDDIEVVVNISGIDAIVDEIDLLSALLCSKIEMLSLQVSYNDALILTALDTINVNVDVSAIVSKLDSIESREQVIESKIDALHLSANDNCCSTINEMSSKIDILINNDALILTAIDSINININISEIVSQLDIIESKVDSIGSDTSILQVIESKLDNVESKVGILSGKVSYNDALILTAIDTVGVTVVVEASLLGEALCSKVDMLYQQTSYNDALILSAVTVGNLSNDSKLGALSDYGTCLDTLIDVPMDINNLNLTIIGLLKTILLELRGCNG